MKRILKYFLFGIVLCLGLVAFSFNDNVMPFICHAVNNETCKVNFYGADNETILYSRDIEMGTTLNEIKSKNLLHISSDLSRGSSTSHHTFASEEDQTITVTCVANSSTFETTVAYITPVVLKANTTYYVRLFNAVTKQTSSLDLLFQDGTYTGAVWLYKNNSLYSNVGLLFNRYQSNLTYTPTQDQTVTGIGLTIGNQIAENGSFEMSFVLSLTSSTYFEPYFDDFQTYIDKEYLKSAGVNDYSTDVSWSISPNSDSKFSFYSPINHNYK